MYLLFAGRRGCRCGGGDVAGEDDEVLRASSGLGECFFGGCELRPWRWGRRRRSGQAAARGCGGCGGELWQASSAACHTARKKGKRDHGGAEGQGKGLGRCTGSWGGRSSPENEGHGGGNCELRRGIAPAWGHDWRGCLRGMEEGMEGSL